MNQSRKLFKTAGILEIIYFSFTVLAGLAVSGTGILLASIGDAALNDPSGPFYEIIQQVGSIFVNMTGAIFIIAGLIILGISITLLIISTKDIKTSKLSVQEFEGKRGGIITFLVFNCIFAFFALISIFTGFSIFSFIGLVMLLLIVIFKIIDLVKNRNAFQNADNIMATNENVNLDSQQQSDEDILSTEIKKLEDLKNNGVISQQEYDSLRESVLRRHITK